MQLYSGMDLHSTNSVLAVVDQDGRRVYRRRLANEMGTVLRELAPYQERVVGVAVESTYNWYWLVDGLMEAGYRVHLANPAAMVQYEGLKHTDDHSDATWLAELLRLGILPQGYIYPREQRGLRDLLRKRSQLVRQRTMQLLSLGNEWTRVTGQRLRGDRVKRLTADEVKSGVGEPDRVLSMEAGLAVVAALTEQIGRLEQVVLARGLQMPAFQGLQTVPGIGKVLGLTIALEVGDVGRFAEVGHYASYCRCVPSQKLSNGKRKGKGNRKNGNRYLAWAYIEAAHFVVRYCPAARRYYQRKRARSRAMVALKVVAHKLARATYYMMRDGVPFQVHRAFG